MVDQLPSKKPLRQEMLVLELNELDQAKLPHELRSGDLCPSCRAGRLDYDGMLNLSCPVCGYAVGGCFT
jgi:uncharacterized protein (DUF983 family)